ncbi:MAG: diphthine--ammonia ligase [Nitrososphaerales archaeon]|nr:diphthine--ammonia ligase [Nitrososphaerales archaeon]
MIKGEKLRMLALSSGGKDSILALHLAHERGWKLDGIVTIIPEDPESMLYHTYNLNFVGKIAESIGTQWFYTYAKKGEEEKALESTLKRIDTDIVVSGSVSSMYQKRHFDDICNKIGIRHFTPLWGLDAHDIMYKILNLKMDVMIVAVAAYGLGEEWLGVHLDDESVKRLLRLSEKYHFNPVGEGGDLDTFVLDAPLYKKRLVVSKAVKNWYLDHGNLKIEELLLIEKD